MLDTSEPGVEGALTKQKDGMIAFESILLDPASILPLQHKDARKKR